MIVDELIEYSLKYYKGQKIKDVRIGVRFVAVMLDDDSCGISYCFSQPGPFAPVDRVGTLIGTKADEIVKLANGLNLCESSLAIATMNALLQNEEFDCIEQNAMDFIEITKKDTVGMIGQFVPLIEAINEKAGKFYVFEKNGNFETYPDWSEPMLLPECDVVLISGTTLLNKTMDAILNSCTKAREVVILGPTAVPASEIFKKYGVTTIGASKVTDAQGMLEIVSQGGSGVDVTKCNQMFCIKIK